MLNRALRTMELDIIIMMGFFVRDLLNHIATLHAEQYGREHQLDCFTVYRGQGLSQTDFNQMKETQGCLISFNNFLSTSLDRAVSFAFAESNQYNSDLIGVLFEINIDPSISSFSFANVRNVGYYSEEEEILFSMHSVFRIGQMKQIEDNDRLWQVNLTLTNDSDPQLQALTKNIQEETEAPTGCHRLDKLMLRLGELKRVQELYEILLKQATRDDEKGGIYVTLGEVKFLQGQYAETLTYHEKSIEIRRKFLPVNHPDFATNYNNIGLVYEKMGEYWKALLYCTKALEIRKKTLPANHPDFTQSYNNIGLTYNKIGEYSKALSYCEKAFEIHQNILPANHPDLATFYSNIGLLYDERGEYSTALSYYQKALEIQQIILPANHPHFAYSCRDIGVVFYKMGEYSKALSYLERALDIFQCSLPSNHPHLKTVRKTINGVKKKL
jgi:tetratricopeptide (TPR) repeat protein